jgi:lactate dehydrogenase-like 2-hydroxyacid dehydrogenase
METYQPIQQHLLKIQSTGKWRGRNELGHDPQNKVLGIIGMGGIGGVRVPPNHIPMTEKRV